EVAGTRVVAKPSPLGEHLLELGPCQCHNAGPPGEEARIIGDHRSDRGLLQHDLGKPNGVRVGLPACRRTPWQLAPLAVAPITPGAGGVRAPETELQLFSCHTRHGAFSRARSGTTRIV